MRQFLAVGVLGAILGLAASAAFAEGNGDPRLPKPGQTAPVVGTTDETKGVVAGPEAPAPPSVDNSNHEK